jgi:argininosuccinate lyase
MAQDLGFSRVSENSLDTVSNRDEQMEVLSILSILMVRLSRLAEDLLLWSSPAFGFVELNETFCTSSSLMPQKKNPDGLELVRGKAAHLISLQVSLFITCKGLPNGYQKDLQEDKEPLFRGIDTALSCLKLCTGIVEGLSLNRQKAQEAILPESLATDMADGLVKEGVPFREAYDRVAHSFAERESEGSEVTAEQDLTPEDSVERRNSYGGTSRDAVLAQLERARRRVGSKKQLGS